MKLFDAKVQMGRGPGELFVAFEGDDLEAKSGNWSASGGVAPFLWARDGYWTFASIDKTDNNWKTGPDGIMREIWLYDGRFDSANHVGRLALPADFPAVNAEPSSGTIQSKYTPIPVHWTVIRRHVQNDSHEPESAVRVD
jgi:hypothetical protein